MQELHNSTLYWLRAEYRQTGLAQDASPAIMMRDAMRKLSRRWRKKFDVLAGKLAERFASDVMKNSDASLSTALQQAGFTVPFKMTAEMNNALQATITENVNLIRSIPQQYLTQVETLVMQSVSRGRDLGTLTKSCNSAMASPGAGRLYRAGSEQQGNVCHAVGAPACAWHPPGAVAPFPRRERAAHLPCESRRQRVRSGQRHVYRWRMDHARAKNTLQVWMGGDFTGTGVMNDD